MVELNHRDRTIKVKIVYYGPPVGGKTTNLQVLHQHASAGRRGEMISINSAQDRTILFDLLPLKTAGFRGFDLQLQILAVPGQAMYAATRRLVLKGADSLVFVANSAVDRWEENLQSYREMTQNLLIHHLDPANMPLVLQYNKRDLPEIMEVETMDRALNGRKVDSIPAVAVRGEGVLETFTAILLRTIHDLANRYAILEAKGGQPALQWTQQAVAGIFGTNTLAHQTNRAPDKPPPPTLSPIPDPRPGPASAPPSAPTPPRPAVSPAPAPPAPASSHPPVAPPPRTVVRVAPQAEESQRSPGGKPDARANETLVESYAEASTQLGAAITDLREERDLARRRLEDLQKTLLASQDILAGKPLESTLKGVLSRMADVTRVSQATFLLPQSGGRGLRAAALLGLRDEPVLPAAGALRHVLESAPLDAPHLHDAADNLDLGQALDHGEPSFAAVLSVPFRTPRGLQGLALLYYTPDAVRPAPETLAHLGELSRALSASLELVATLETVRGAERALELALTGTASLRGLEDVVRSLVELRDRLGEMRHRPDAPRWFLEEFARLAPSLASALSVGRSLLAFNKGEIEREPILVEDLLDELRSELVTVRIAPGAESVSGDPALLRVAVRTLLDHVRGLGGNVPVEIRAEAGGGRVLLSVGLPTSVAGTSSSPPGLGLSLARKIAELHGGSLGTASVPGVEDWFVLSLFPG
jgi:signal recognition particle receptor subunit beta